MILNNDSHTNRTEFLFQDIPAVGVGGYEQATAALGVAEPEFYYIGQGAEVLLQLTDNTDVIAFYEQMGAGKTTCIKALCEVLGIGDQVTSPNFTLVNEYLSAEGIPIYHFDFYRIKNLQEAWQATLDVLPSGERRLTVR